MDGWMALQYTSQRAPPKMSGGSLLCEGKADWLLETLQKPARWDHPTAPPNVRPVAVATGRSQKGS